MQQDDERLVKIEMMLADHERLLEELNEVMIWQGKEIKRLSAQNQYLADLLKNDTVKPLSEETPPPHY